MTDKRMTEEDVVAELRDGMTIGIGGWGSRRKPMSIVRAILRSDLKDLTIVAYGGPDVGMLCAAGKVRKAVYGFVSLDSIPLEPHFRAARQNGTIEAMELDEGMLQWGLRAAAMRVDVPAVPRRPRLRDHWRSTPTLATVRVARTASEEYVAMPALHARRRAPARQPRRRPRQRAVPRPRLVLRRPVLRWPRERTFVSCERIVEPGDFLAEGPRVDDPHQPHVHRRRGRGAVRRALHALRARLPARRGDPEGVRGDSAKEPGRVGRRSGPSTSTSPKPTTAA